MARARGRGTLLEEELRGDFLGTRRLEAWLGRVEGRNQGFGKAEAKAMGWAHGSRRLQKHLMGQDRSGVKVIFSLWIPG